MSGKWNEVINQSFKNMHVLVIGDLMVDEYVTGQVSRISPEAPVPILNYKESTMKAGGASNVAANIRSLGASVSLCGLAAEDKQGLWLRENLDSKGINTIGIFCESGRPTSLKTRYATKGQQLMRVDNEVCAGITEQTKEKILTYINDIICYINAVVISDYCKGIFDEPDFVRNIIYTCKKNGVFVAIDSKSKNISAFKGADFVKPNNLELESAVSIKIVDNDSLTCAGERYLQLSGSKKLIVTRGSDGISIFEPGSPRRDYPADIVQVFDVTGAGDTVISVITLCLISGLSIDEAVIIANKAAGITISRVGTTTVSDKELIEYLNEK